MKHLFLPLIIAILAASCGSDVRLDLGMITGNKRGFAASPFSRDLFFIFFAACNT